MVKVGRAAQRSNVDVFVPPHSVVDAVWLFANRDILTVHLRLPWTFGRVLVERQLSSFPCVSVFFMMCATVQQDKARRPQTFTPMFAPG